MKGIQEIQFSLMKRKEKKWDKNSNRKIKKYMYICPHIVMRPESGAGWSSGAHRARVVWYNISRRPFFGSDDLALTPPSYHRSRRLCCIFRARRPHGGVPSFFAFPSSSVPCLSSSLPLFSISKPCLSNLTHLIVQLPRHPDIFVATFSGDL